MSWTILLTTEAEEWLKSLDARDRVRMAGAIDQLAQKGPMLGRPIVDSITGSRHSNMKELRSVGGNLRALFAFDPNRAAIVLFGGDKTNNWKGWYRESIPVADDLLDAHLRSLT